MFYRLARFICRVVLKVLRRWEIHGVHNIPQSGGLIVVSNHISYWDPVVVGCAYNRTVNFMAKMELFNIPGLGFIITRLGAFPVNRSSKDTASIRRSLGLLNEGEVIGIFPEGTRSHSQEMLEPHLGAALLAYKSGAPVQPVAVKGTRGVQGKVYVSIGEPLYLNPPSGQRVRKEQLQEMSSRIMNELSRLYYNI